MVRSTNVNNCH